MKTCAGTVFGLIFWVAVIVVGVAVCQSATDIPNSPTSTTTPKPRLSKLPWTERCFSAWDGSHAGVNELIKADLVSPDSFEHVETLYSVKPDADGTHRLKVTFSSVNAFNARLRNVSYGSVDPVTCRAIG